jgi:hypothetical protein
MKCDYCGAEDHLITACGKKSYERVFEKGGGCILLLLLSPFYILGFLSGAVGSAFSDGWRLCHGLWSTALSKVRGNDESAP